MCVISIVHSMNFNMAIVIACTHTFFATDHAINPFIQFMLGAKKNMNRIQLGRGQINMIDIVAMVQTTTIHIQIHT